MCEDPRDRPRLTHQDILALNFIRASTPYVFRRHYRSGLRSHIMEVLDPRGVEGERGGILVNGVRHFPRATPLKMLRIFRTRFRGMREAEEELRRVKVVEAFLAPEFMALSSEFLVHFAHGTQRELLLCGVQEYVAGEVLDPWGTLRREHLAFLHGRMSGEHTPPRPGVTEEWLRRVRHRAEAFIRRLKSMILKSGHVPDLAGVGNLLLTLPGPVRLVDINNISRVPLDSTIPLDDRGYPVCDKSVEALFLLEEGLLERPADVGDPFFRSFLDPGRMREVKALEESFHSIQSADPS